jgi:hypothetical protein
MSGERKVFGGRGGFAGVAVVLECSAVMVTLPEEVGHCGHRPIATMSLSMVSSSRQKMSCRPTATLGVASPDTNLPDCRVPRM